MTMAMGLRDRKRMRARQTLENAALELFERRGFESTTVAEIAQTVDMSPRTFFRYFGSKEDVLFSRASSHLSVVRDELLQRPLDESRYAAIRGVLLEYAEYLERRKDWIARRARIITTHPHLRARSADETNIWGDALAQDLATRAGAVSPRRVDVLIVSVALKAFTCAWTSWLEEGCDKTLSALLRENFHALQEEMAAASRT